MNASRADSIRAVSKSFHKTLDVREFFAYTESFEANRINPVAHFARREMTFPKSLLGYQADKKEDEARRLIVTDIPSDYLTARAAYLCPMDLVYTDANDCRT